MAENNSDRLEQIQARLADWANSPNGVSIKLSAKGPKGDIRHVAAMIKHAAGDLQHCLGEIQRLEGVRIRLEQQQQQVRQALYDHAGEHRVGERECRDALEIRALRAQRDLLVCAVRKECAKFTFPDEDRPDLYEALQAAEKIGQEDGLEATFPSSVADPVKPTSRTLDLLRIERAIAQADDAIFSVFDSAADERGDQ